MTDPAYRVLARKYRPQRFDQLIGQEAVVRTLANAIGSGRVAQAWVLTGVRGVGKTTTARLIAKALNCIGPDGTGGPTISPCDACDPCRAIAEGRFIDVLEIDAASNTGVDKMRELLDGVPYAAVLARYKVYVIDEVHMLSTSSFNALLKTLEEPPGHVKFIFATTEVAKLPVTILSRCQRFDLRRIPADRLEAHYAAICEAEGVPAEPSALALIAAAAEGSARDGLSLLDQAIAHGAGTVTEAAVADMLGLADRGRVRALLAAVLEADAPAVLERLAGLDALGADPALVLKDLLGLVHQTARRAAGAGPDPARAQEENAALGHWAERLGPATLHRLWQLLLRGHAETASAALPRETAEMALLRLVHAAGLPDPADLLRGGDGDAPAAATAPARPRPPADAPAVPPTHAAALASPADFAALVAALEPRAPMLAHHLHDGCRPALYAPPHLELAPLADLPRGFPADLARELAALTGARWTVTMVAAAAEPSMRERETAARDRVLADPAVAALTAAFPGAELLDYSPPHKEARA